MPPEQPSPSEADAVPPPPSGYQLKAVVFDVNETLSDMTPLRGRFEDVGAPADLMQTWFAGVLRDGFALTCVGQDPEFAQVASEGLRVRAAATLGPDVDPEPVVERVMTALMSLGVHTDVVDGVTALHDAGLRLVTLSNGSAGVAEALLSGADVRDRFERLLSVADAGAWKPHPTAYAFALETCEVAPGEAMLVAVHPWDVDGAARAGLRTAWLNRTGGRYPAYFTAPDVEAPGLPELARLLG